MCYFHVRVYKHVVLCCARYALLCYCIAICELRELRCVIVRGLLARAVLIAALRYCVLLQYVVLCSCVLRWRYYVTLCYCELCRGCFRVCAASTVVVLS